MNLFANVTDEYTGPVIRAYFSNGSDATYPAHTAGLLVEDPATIFITSEATGEILWMR